MSIKNGLKVLLSQKQYALNGRVESASESSV